MEPVTDASGNLEYDLRLIPAEQVESIEIMKGAASTLYGSVLQLELSISL
jgi:vitamin B12 transporter